jgi:hypothetical protein
MICIVLKYVNLTNNNNNESFMRRVLVKNNLRLLPSSSSPSWTCDVTSGVVVEAVAVVMSTKIVSESSSSSWVGFWLASSITSSSVTRTRVSFWREKNKKCKVIVKRQTQSSNKICQKTWKIGTWKNV